MFEMLSNILVILSLTSIDYIVSEGYYNDDLFSLPDLTNHLIPLKWRENCGFRLIPIKIRRNSPCFKRNYTNIIVANNPCDSCRINYGTPHSRKAVVPTNRILGGSRVSNRESPWTVEILRKNHNTGAFDAWCTGVLLTMKIILTAAHCWNNADPLFAIMIYAGNDESVTQPAVIITKTGFYQHPHYRTRDENGTMVEDVDYDIGVIRLSQPIDWESHQYEGNSGRQHFRINTICLPLPENFHDPNIKIDGLYYKNATFFGWGLVFGYHSISNLQRADVSVSLYISTPNPPSNDIHWFESKAEGREQRGCEGDSGSGLVQYLDRKEDRAVLIGIQSIVENLSDKTEPPCDYKHVGRSFFIRVVRHLPWIQEHLLNATRE